MVAFLGVCVFYVLLLVVWFAFGGWLFGWIGAAILHCLWSLVVLVCVRLCWFAHRFLCCGVFMLVVWFVYYGGFGVLGIVTFCVLRFIG